MSKRKITKQQHRRISDKQASHKVSSDDKPAEELEGLGPEQWGLLISRFGKQVEVEDEQGQRHDCHLRQHLPMPVAGDHVLWCQSQAGNGVVVAIKNRKSELVRVSSIGQLKPIAANIDQMLIVISTAPEPSFLQLDKFLIAAQQLQITPCIVINKADLSSAKALLKKTKSHYQLTQHSIIYASAKQAHGIDELTLCLQHKTSILVGQSGVGKSSLIQMLIPEDTISVGDLSLQSKLGTHTTTAARLYHLPTGGDLIDSPGVRQFNLWPISQQQLLAGYTEFTPYLDHCKFRNCKHDHETQCAVKDAVSSGVISNLRYENYLDLLHNFVNSGD